MGDGKKEGALCFPDSPHSLPLAPSASVFEVCHLSMLAEPLWFP